MNPELKDVLYYCEDSLSCLRWKVNDCVAGTIDTDGYWVVRYKDKGYKAHRIIWFMFNNEIPSNMIIDHVDRNRQNNKILNLRLSTWEDNTRNASKSVKNSSGITGVSRQGNYWRANWNENGKTKGKLFSINIYGEDKAFDLAVKYRESMIDLLKLKGIYYAETHGK